MKSAFFKKLAKGFDGEAPKGMVGQTESGKAVLGGDAEGYSKDFNADDHRDAEKIHSDHQAKTQIKQRSFMNGKAKGFNHRLLAVFSDKEAKHSKQAKYHAEQAEVVAEEQVKQKAAEQAAQAANAVEKSFLEKLEELDLEKGGPGSGKKGHTTDRKPYPGEESHNVDSGQKKEKPARTMQWHELPPDHYTTPGLSKYKKLLKLMGEEANGHFTYDPKSDKVMAISSEAKDKIKKLMGKDKLDSDPGPKEIKDEPKPKEAPKSEPKPIESEPKKEVKEKVQTKIEDKKESPKPRFQRLLMTRR